MSLSLDEALTRHRRSISISVRAEIEDPANWKRAYRHRRRERERAREKRSERARVPSSIGRALPSSFISHRYVCPPRRLFPLSTLFSFQIEIYKLPNHDESSFKWILRCQLTWLQDHHWSRFNSLLKRMQLASIYFLCWFVTPTLCYFVILFLFLLFKSKLSLLPHDCQSPAGMLTMLVFVPTWIIRDIFFIWMTCVIRDAEKERKKKQKKRSWIGTILFVHRWPQLFPTSRS